MHSRKKRGPSRHSRALLPCRAHVLPKDFLDTVGDTAMDYLTDWRISLAQGLLKRGKPLKAVAPAVGYTSETTFARAFSRRTGVSPTNWVARLKVGG
uniref:HTH araC/xylS-type domain-containing protein n=1 Tax=Curvibacter symbiont subsp. Hydra magnipapillata TaxID=667019 RepID=C9YBP2_CURXX|nr:hypothetical protein Csp_A15430 [Curvibacter putative symbiont of Hydra magnipapillata]